MEKTAFNVKLSSSSTTTDPYSAVNYSQLTQTNTNLSSLESDVSTLQSNVSTLQSDVSTLESQVAGLSAGSTTIRHYFPQIVANIVTLDLSGTITPASTGASSGEYVVIHNQAITSNDGLWVNNSGTMTKIAKNTDPLIGNVVFVCQDSEFANNQSYYIYTSDTFINSEYKFFSIYYTLQTTTNSTESIFGIPVIEGRCTFIEIDCYGRNASERLYRHIKNVYYNNTSSIETIGLGYKESANTTSPGGLSSADVAFSGTSPPVLQVTGVSEETINWVISGTIKL